MSTPAHAQGERTELLAAAVEFARGAGALVLRHYASGSVAHDRKADGSPVTVADREAESFLRERIHHHFPGHGVLGEEMGETDPGSRVRWILDPIDATRAFMRGVPFFGVLVGVEVDGRAVVGVAHFPALQETVAAAEGLGCTWNGSPCRVSTVGRLEDALILTTDYPTLQARPEGPGWAELEKRAWTSRTWGDCYGHALVATGRAEIMLDAVLKAWDASPFLPIVTEAGGRFTDLSGVPTVHGGSALSSNGLLHEEVLAALGRG